jgi:23S rRNA (pseudouridine1915-N3)-methyltransferase
MKVNLLCVGTLKGPVAAVAEDYEARAGRYFRFQVTEVEGGVGKVKKTDPNRVREAEAERILARIPEGEVLALTRDGKLWRSRELATYLEELAVRATPEVTFVIGGAFGLAPSVLDRAALTVSLSKMTLPHELARVVLAEQLYRAGTIQRNEPYHKGP